MAEEVDWWRVTIEGVALDLRRTQDEITFLQWLETRYGHLERDDEDYTVWDLPRHGTPRTRAESLW